MPSSYKKRWAGLLPFALPALLLARHAGYVPVFDGRVYADCLVKMATHPTWSGLTCAGHPSHAYVAFMSGILAVAPSSTTLLLLGNVLLLLVGLFAFRRILGRLYPEPELWWERDVLTAVLACHPVLLACTLQPSPDVAVVSFTLLTLDALLAGHVFLAGTAGLALVFTKEIGNLSLLTLLCVFAVVSVTRGAGTPREKFRALARLWPAALPLVIFAARVLYLRASTGAAGFVTPPDNAGGPSAVVSEFLSIRLLDRTFLSYAAGILVLQFQWIQTVIIAGWAALLGLRWLFAETPPEGAAERRSAVLSLALFAAFFLVTTRYRTYSTPRYWIVNYPFTLLATYAALRELRVSVGRRAAILGTVIVLFLVSLRATVDPLSRAVYGTFAFGRHTMLRMTSITGYPFDRFNGGEGRDQLVYNLQFAEIANLQNAILSAARRGPPRPFLVDDASLWHLWDRVDGRTFRRTLDLRAGYVPIMNVAWLRNRPPLEAYYVLYPMFRAVQEPVLQKLERFYTVKGRWTIESGGYSAEVLALRIEPERFREWLAADPAPINAPPPSPPSS